MRTTCLALSLVICLSLLVPPVSAHFVKSDGSIGTLLHMDPEDDPVAGKQSNIILEFKDTNDKFDLNNCDCRLTILEDGKELSSIPLAPVSDQDKLSSVTPFTFPEKNIYQLKITGSAKNNEFKSFELGYDVRVSRQTTTDNNGTASSWLNEHAVPLIGGGVIIIFLIFALIIQIKKKGGVS